MFEASKEYRTGQRFEVVRKTGNDWLRVGLVEIIKAQGNQTAAKIIFEFEQYEIKVGDVVSPTV